MRAERADPDAACAYIFATQYGVIHRDQALAAGMSPRGISRRVTCGDWVRLRPRTYRSSAVAPTWRSELISACLSAGSGCAVARRSAACIWMLDGFDEGPVEIISDRPRRCRGVPTFSASHLTTGDLTVVDGLPITRVTRTLIDLSVVLPDLDLEIALDSALRQRLTSIDYLARRIARGARAAKGSRRLLALLGERSNRPGTIESALETRLWAVLKRSPLPLPVPQYEIREGGELIARADFAYPEQRVAIECEGYRYHQGMGRWRVDLERRNRLFLAGWHVIHVTFWDLRYRPSYVVATIADALGLTLALHT